MKTWLNPLLMLGCLLPGCAVAQVPDTSTRAVVGGFIDSYFAYDFNHPRTLDRAYTTQAARHDEFNVNLAFVDLTLTGNRLRGRFAAQFGTSVQANYAGEPRVGTLSGPDVSRFIQEAYVGYRVATTVWVDGGVFFSPFGSENWISRDNWTYTRSLIADYSPYYEAGVKATWQATPKLSAQLHVINGWQNISETNSDKALGARVDYAATSRLTLSYDSFYGNEAPDSLPARPRYWNEGILQFTPISRLQFRGTLDYGTQQRGGAGGHAVWRGYTVITHWQATPRVAAAARIEGYGDPEQVIIATGRLNGFRAQGGSVNLDLAPQPRLLWRAELRGLWSRDPLFTHGGGIAGGASRRDIFVVSSLALTL